MGLTSFPNGITSFGVPVVGSGNDLLTTGSVFFVHSGTGNDGNTGESPDAALATLDAAINKCTASVGDIVVAMPGHSETISNATSIVPDVAGVKFVGLGEGDNRPKIDFDNTASQVIFSAANQTIKNFVFECSVDSLVAALSVTASGVSILGCEFAAPTTAQNCLVWVLTTADADKIRVEGCRTSGLGNFEAGASEVVRLVGTDDAVVKGNYFNGDHSTATVNNVTTAALRVEISHNVLINENTTADLAIALVGTTTGYVGFNTGRCGNGAPITGGAITAANDCVLAENYFANLDAETGALVGAVST